MSPPPAPSPDRRRARLHALAVAVLAAATYANTLPNQPVLDDGYVIFENPLVKDLARVGELFRQPWGYAGPASFRGTYRPLTSLTFAVNWALGGRAVAGYHVVNLLLHAVAALLVWALARRLVASASPARAPAAALVAGVLFAVHAVHVEAVAGLVGRAELLSTVGILGVLLVLATPRWGRWRLAGAAAVLALAVLCKENAAVAPALAVLAAIACPAAFGLGARPGLRGEGPRRAAAEVAIAAGVLLATVALYLVLRPIPFAAPETRWFAGQPRATVLVTMTQVLAEYLRLLAFPHPLGGDFTYAARFPMATGLTAAAIASTAAWAAVLAAGVAVLGRRPVTGLGLLWIFAALAPVLNVLVPTGALLAERFLYLPSVGFCLAAGDLASSALGALASRPRARAALAAALGVAAAAHAGTALARNLDWRDGLALWTAELARAPRDPVVNNNLAVELTARGDTRRALERLDVAIASSPRYWRAHVNRGIALQRHGDRAAAERDFRAAEAIDPGAPEPPFFLGVLRLEEGRPADALEAFERAEARAPWSARTHLWKATALERLGRGAEARAALERAAALDPKDPEARRRLAAAP